MAITEEISAMSDADLRARVLELEEERFRLKFRAATETLEQPLRLRTVRRDIARLLTLLRQREIAAAPPEQTPKERRRENRRTGRAAERAAVKAADRANRKKPSTARRPKGSGGKSVKGPRTAGAASSTTAPAATAAPTT